MSVLIGLLGNPNPIVARAIESGGAEIPPLVIAELVTGAVAPWQREQIGDLLQDVPVYETDLNHWFS